LLDNCGDRLRNQPHLFGQAEDRQTDQLKYVHGVMYPKVRLGTRSVTEWQILFDAIHIGCADKCGLAQRPAALGAFALQQMSPARATAQHFAGASDLETFGH
jgi:hypothetical protein